MITQVIFKIDKKLKERAMKKAEGEGLAFSTVLKLATQAYANGKLYVELAPPPRFNARTRRMLRQELAEIKQGKNLSPRFRTAKETISFLKSL